jgi:hypothetical protein
MSLVFQVGNWLLKQQAQWLEMHDFDPVVYGNIPHPPPNQAHTKDDPKKNQPKK